MTTALRSLTNTVALTTFLLLVALASFGFGWATGIASCGAC